MAGRLRSRATNTGSRGSTHPSKATNTADPAPRRAGTRYEFIGGKGGVGKTTCAAALGVMEASRGARTLVVSTDPAPSLGAAFGVPLGRTPRVVPLGRSLLHAVEVDARKAFMRWLRRRQPLLETIALRGTWLDREDVAMLLGLSLPGIDEIAGLLEVARFGQSGRYDRIVVDTAPTGHTLQLLAMPDTFGAVARVFDRMQDRHRALVEALRGRWDADAADDLVHELLHDAAALRAMLRDEERTAVSWVALPEPMAVEETIDAASWLIENGLAPGRIIVNHATPAPPGRCSWCSARRALQASAMAALQQGIRALPGVGEPRFVQLHARETEPVGVRPLARMGADLVRAQPLSRPSRRPAARRVASPPLTGSDLDFLIPQLNAIRKSRSDPGAPGRPGGPGGLVMFGGKGGVGKTTCAAAAALRIATEHPRRRVLLLSTDPAHSLADAVGVPVSDLPRALPGGPPNLDVREQDALEAYRQIRREYAEAIDALFDRLVHGSAGDATYDRRVMHGLIDLAPPGLDELAAVLSVIAGRNWTDGRERSPHGPSGPRSDVGRHPPYDLIVMDTAPSGHALRLLEMPSLVQEWTNALMRILLKYQPVAGMGDLGALLLRLSQDLRHLQAFLRDPTATQFILIIRAASLPRLESVRLTRRLARLKVHVAAVIVNATGAGECARCLRQRRRERREIARIRTDLCGGSRPLVLAPAEVPPPHGVRALLRWRGSWRSARARPGLRGFP